MLKLALAAAAVVGAVPAGAMIIHQQTGVLDQHDGGHIGGYHLNPNTYTLTFSFDAPIDGLTPYIEFESHYHQFFNGEEYGANRDRHIVTFERTSAQTFTAIMVLEGFRKYDRGGGYYTEYYDDQFVGGVFDAHNESPMPVNYLFTIESSHAPEPATWGMMILGFGLAGAATRKRREARSIRVHFPEYRTGSQR